MRHRSIAALAVSAAFAAVVAAAPTASAEPNPPGCPKQYFCAYSGEGQSGSLLLKTAGNWSGSVAGVRSVFNNGVRFVGGDHVQLSWRFNGRDWGQCFHYNPGPGEYKANFVGVTVTKVVWRGEC
ncbi:peptidase inhibitor family I36 protein [Streptomyces sp. NPDC059568]|uniref:peptidase inhibitor family I36 protein n=1 Tax=Streptomyces sp. NPDC059568 TaxID=3346868 RepID=UPI0036A39FD5